MAITLHKDLCVGCGCCSDVCPQGALELNTKALVNEDNCIECLNCIEMCPVSALKL